MSQLRRSCGEDLVIVSLLAGTCFDLLREGCVAIAWLQIVFDRAKSAAAPPARTNLVE